MPEPVYDLQAVQRTLQEILATLSRIEGRQIKTTRMVEEIEEHEPPVTGSFGTTELPKS